MSFCIELIHLLFLPIRYHAGLRRRGGEKVGRTPAITTSRTRFGSGESRRASLRTSRAAAHETTEREGAPSSTCTSSFTPNNLKGTVTTSSRPTRASERCRRRHGGNLVRSRKCSTASRRLASPGPATRNPFPRVPLKVGENVSYTRVLECFKRNAVRIPEASKRKLKAPHMF